MEILDEICNNVQLCGMLMHFCKIDKLLFKNSVA
jgi:hypothetical protein